MKKIVLMVAVVACVAFASQGVQASTVQVSVENVMQDDFVKIEVKELPQAVQDAIAKSYEGSTVKGRKPMLPVPTVLRSIKSSLSTKIRRNRRLF